MTIQEHIQASQEHLRKAIELAAETPSTRVENGVTALEGSIKTSKAALWIFNHQDFEQ